MGRGGIEMGIEMERSRGTKRRLIHGWCTAYNLVVRWPAIEIKIYGLTWTRAETPRRSFHARSPISWVFAAISLFFWIKFHAPLETLKKTIITISRWIFFFNRDPSLEKHFYRSLGNFDYMRINIILWRISGQKLGEDLQKFAQVDNKSLSPDLH